MDVVIVSRTDDDRLRAMTQNCIDTLMKSEEIDFRVFMIEANENVSYDCEMLRQSGEINYNRCLNMGLERCNSEFITFCNNDLIFMKGWLSSHLDVFKQRPDIHSLSPKCHFWHGEEYSKHTSFTNGIYEGYRTKFEFTGWCFTVRSLVFDKIGRFDESVSFWYSDTIFATQLKRSRMKHALNANSHVIHLFNQSHHLCNDTELKSLTTGQKEHFEMRKKYLNSPKLI